MSISDDIYSCGGKYYKRVQIEDGVSIEDCPNLARAYYWGYPVVEAPNDDPRVIEAAKEIHRKMMEDPQKLEDVWGGPWGSPWQSRQNNGGEMSDSDKCLRRDLANLEHFSCQDLSGNDQV